ncbi:MAG: DUF86 domain-containing protein [Sedimentisphaerales bacterium]|nr:DUF86 domain-containing protein [Sedimentisphaerales bacterium]
MSRDELMYIRDIASSCEKVIRFTKGMDMLDLIHDDKTYDAVVRNLEIIGEAAKHVSDALRIQMQEIEWRRIAGMRDMLAHDYFGIDNDILWDVVQHKVPQLSTTINSFLNEQHGNY